MQIWIRFLSINRKLPKSDLPFSVEEGISVESLLREVDEAGSKGAFSAPADWMNLPEDVLVASEGRMLQPDETLRDGQKIRIIGQLIGG